MVSTIRVIRNMGSGTVPYILVSFLLLWLNYPDKKVA